MFSKPKDYSKGSPDMITMLEANEARTEESATMNSRWAPGALKRHKKLVKKLAKQEKAIAKSSTPDLDRMLAKHNEPTTRLGKAYKRLKEKMNE